MLGDAKDDTATEVATVPREARGVRVRRPSSHTSGFTYGSFMSNDARLERGYDRAGVQGRRGTRRSPSRLRGSPRSRWLTSPARAGRIGLSHDVLGRVIEVVSGESLSIDILQRTIFTPLDMADTVFFVPEAKRDRVATIYRSG